MARRCKCFITQEDGTTDIFVKRPVGKQYKYFKSEEIYQKYIKEKEQKTLLHNKVAELLDYKMLPPFLLKELNELMFFYSVEVIIETFRQQNDTLKYWLSLDGKFNSEFAKVRYIMAIIKNNINEVDKQWKAEQKRKQSQSINIDIDMMDTTFTVHKGNKDISDFL